MHITNISEAKSSLSQLIKTVQKTKEPIIIAKAGQPVAILSAYKESKSPRKLGGSWEGAVEISDDFDDSDHCFYSTSIFPDK